MRCKGVLPLANPAPTPNLLRLIRFRAPRFAGAKSNGPDTGKSPLGKHPAAYCTDYKCTRFIKICADRWRMMFGCLILGRYMMTRITIGRPLRVVIWMAPARPRPEPFLSEWNSPCDEAARRKVSVQGDHASGPIARASSMVSRFKSTEPCCETCWAISSTSLRMRVNCFRQLSVRIRSASLDAKKSSTGFCSFTASLSRDHEVCRCTGCDPWHQHRPLIRELVKNRSPNGTAESKLTRTSWRGGSG